MPARKMRVMHSVPPCYRHAMHQASYLALLPIKITRAAFFPELSAWLGFISPLSRRTQFVEVTQTFQKFLDTGQMRFVFNYPLLVQSVIAVHDQDTGVTGASIVIPLRITRNDL